MPAHPSENTVRYVCIDANSDGQRLDNFLVRELKGLPKSAIYRIIRRGEVRVNKGRAKPTTRLRSGDSVRVPPVRDISIVKAAPGPNDFSPVVLFEDEHLLAIDKPSGVAVHAGSQISAGVIELLRANRPQNPFLELVHRLDRDTSGCLLIAKTRPSLVALHAKLRDQGGADAIQKHYLALVNGDLSGSRRVDRPLDDGGVERHAVSNFRVRKQYVDYTLTEIELLTGRKHQIRRHAQSIGHSLVGDDRYGDYKVNRVFRKSGLKRIFLHAAHIALRHPITNAKLTVASPLPAELTVCLDSL